MKKLLIGFVFGSLLTLATSVAANDVIQTYLFPAKYVINGEAKELGEDYTTLNYLGHAYVPIRYITENLGAVVAYDEKTTTITIDNRFHITDAKGTVRIGNLQVEKFSNKTRVSGQIYVGQAHWDALADARNWSNDYKEAPVSGDLMFYGWKGEQLGKASVEKWFPTSGDRIQNFEVLVDEDLTGYASVTLTNVYPVPQSLPAPSGANATP